MRGSLLLEARPSLNPRQAQALLVATSEFANGQIAWDRQGGWGLLNVLRAVQMRYQMVDDTLSSDQENTYALATPDASQQIVIACAWQRAMVSENVPVLGSPGNLDLYLDRKLGSSAWETISASESLIDNVEVVRATQAAQWPFYEFRVRVRRVGPAVVPQETFSVVGPFLAQPPGGPGGE